MKPPWVPLFRILLDVITIRRIFKRESRKAAINEERFNVFKQQRKEQPPPPALAAPHIVDLDSECDGNDPIPLTPMKKRRLE